MGALAASEHRLGNHSQSLEFYRLANDFVLKQKRIDGDLIHNIVIASVAAGEPLSNAEQRLLFEQQSCFLTEDPFLAERLAALRILVLVQNGLIESGFDFFRLSQLSKQHILDVLIRLAQECSKIGAERDDPTAIRMAQNLFNVALKVAKDKSRTIVIRSYAKFLYECADFYGALELISGELFTTQNDPCLMMEAFWCLIQTEEWKEAIKVLISIKNLVITGRDVEDYNALSEFHYYRGFANWWLGHSEVAAQEFRDSGYGADRQYDNIAYIHLKDKYRSIVSNLQNDMTKSLH